MSTFNLPKPTKRVAIFVPLSDQPCLTPDEEISLRHLRTYLGKYDKFAAVPVGNEIDLPDFKTLQFDQKYFGSADNHKKLLFSTELYQAFSDYEFMLTYHLDALVFSDQLLYWCDKDYDFIGPPWIMHKDAPYAGMSAFENKVGNGGFSLKKVSSFLKILRSSKLAVDPAQYWRKVYGPKPLSYRMINLPKKFLLQFQRFNNVTWELARWRHPEDLFWGERGTYYYPEFNLAPLEEALKFAFEAVPEYCFERNGKKLPFGCHAWQRYNREFWEPYLLER